MSSHETNGHSNRGTRKKGSGFVILKNEPRIVTVEAIERLREQDASSDLIAAAERAAKTNPR
jgi:hypothetical protein